MSDIGPGAAPKRPSTAVIYRSATSYRGRRKRLGQSFLDRGTEVAVGLFTPSRNVGQPLEKVVDLPRREFQILCLRDREFGQPIGGLRPKRVHTFPANSQAPREECQDRLALLVT